MSLLGPESVPPGNGGAPRTGWQRLSETFLRPASPPKEPQEQPDFSRMSETEKRARIVAIDPVERKVGIVASILGVALALYANVPYMVSKISVITTVKPKGKACGTVIGITNLHYVASTKTCNGAYPASHYVLPLIISMVLAAAIYVTVRIRRRAPLAFTLVMTGLAFGSLIVLVPYGLAGAWVMLRAWRTQKYGAPTARGVALEGWTPPPPRGTTRRAKSTGPSSTRRRKAGAEPEKSTARKPPTANKRYTPKAPPPAKPKKKVTPS
jgi:hypothetical protein